MAASYVVMLGASQPIVAQGRAWTAVDGEPGHRTISHVVADAPPDPSVGEEGIEQWVGKLRFSAGDRLDPPADAGGLLIFAQEPRPGDEEEFDDWMDTEHVPALASVEGVLMAHRYEALTGSPRFAALYYLTEPSVCTSEAWQNASRTPWRERMTKRNLNRRRGLYVPATGRQRSTG